MKTVRREFLKVLGRAAAYGLTAPYLITFDRRVSAQSRARAPTTLREDSAGWFDLSVASGDPSATGVMLWTHIRPDVIDSERVLYFQVASDAAFGQLVLEGTVPASSLGAEHDFTVSVDLEGRLGSGQRYYYRFIYGDVVSRVGRCKTLPTGSLSALTLGLLTCQDYTNGYYGALRHLAQDDSIDFVLHLGDVIYETAGDPSFQTLPFDDRKLTLPSGAGVVQGLEDYRALYRIYRTDPWFQAVLERHTFILAPDDHETANDCYWDYEQDTLGAPDHPFTGDAVALRRLKLEAQQAWLEYIPARVQVNAGATHPHDYYKCYRDFRFGDLVQLNMFDTRTYRSPHPCGEGRIFERYLPLGCSAWAGDSQTLLGEAQRGWLSDKLATPGALWNLLGNQTLFAQLSLAGTPIDVDAWDGYDAERRWLTGQLKDLNVSNPVVITGDLHSYVAAEIKVDYGNINPLDLDNYAGVEFMTPSVTSAALFDTLLADVQGDPTLVNGLTGGAVTLTNPHIKFFESQSHGYSVLRFTRDYCEWVAYAVDKNADPATVARTTLARMRKYTWLPTLVPMSTS
jgi:alkaline phosphatase D